MGRVQKTTGFAAVLVLALAATTIPGAIPHTNAAEANHLRIATLAPSGSSWMKIMKAWDRSLSKKTEGKLRLRFYPGGAQGDERDFVRKIRAGQLEGGIVTVTGLSMLVRPVLVLALPNTAETYEKLDLVRTKMAAKFEKLFEDEGYKLLGWGDAGKTRLFSQKELKQPSQLKSMRPWVWKDDLILLEFYNQIGASAVRLGVPEVYPALQTKMVDVVAASALAAVSLQWYTRVKYMTAQNMAIIVGGTVMRKDKFDALSPGLQEALVSTAKKAHDLLNKRIRRDDKKAYASLLKRGIIAVEAGKHKSEWDAIATKVRNGLSSRVYPKSLLAAVDAAAKP